MVNTWGWVGSRGARVREPPISPFASSGTLRGTCFREAFLIILLDSQRMFITRQSFKLYWEPRTVGGEAHLMPEAEL